MENTGNTPKPTTPNQSVTTPSQSTPPSVPATPSEATTPEGFPVVPQPVTVPSTPSVPTLKKKTKPEPLPSISDSELKLPEEQFGNAPVAEKKESKHLVSPWLVIALILILVLLGVVVVWSDTIINMLLPEQVQESMEEGVMMTDEDMTNDVSEQKNVEQDLTTMEADIENSINLNEIDTELDAIDDEFNETS